MKLLKGVLPFVIGLSLLMVACTSPAPTPVPAAPAAAPKAAAPAPAAAPKAPAPAPDAAPKAAAAQPTAAAKASAASTSAGPDRLDQLYEAAKKEGTLVWNVTVLDGSHDPIINAFKKRFPALKVETLGVSATQVPTRVLTEVGTGKVTIDVGWGAMMNLMPLLERNVVPRFDFDGVKNVNKDRVILDGRGVKAFDQVWVAFYNKNLVSEADVPRTWDDLLKPRWKGKVVAGGTGTEFLALPFAMGERQALDYLQKLVKQDLGNLARVAAAQDAINRGEYHLGFATLFQAQQAIKRGDPVEIAPLSPQPCFTSVATSFDKVEHPNAAALLMTWLATDEAKAALAAGGNTIYTQESLKSDPLAKVITDKGIKELQIIDTTEKVALATRARTEYSKILGVGVPR